MASHILLALSICAGVSQAFANTSPFFAFSNKLSIKDSTSHKFLRDRELQHRLSSDWLDCDSTDLFLVVSQPGVAASDYAPVDAAPYLRRSLKSPSGSASLIVSNVVGTLSASHFQKEIQHTCGLPAHEVDPNGPLNIENSFPQILSITFPAPSDEVALRSKQLQKNDETLNAILQGTNANSHSVFFVTSPPTSPQSTAKHHLSQHKHALHRQSSGTNRAATAHPEHQLEYDSEEQFPALIHLDMKRDMQSYAMRDDGNGTLKGAGLFETYNFLNQGVFMGGLVVVLLLTILYVGLSAIGSIEITPFAFSKEMAPSGQKRQN